MQAGERRFAERLKTHLEEDYLCWYDLPVGGRPRYADFIILHPGRGLLILEVKDWKLSSIKRVSKSSVELLTTSGLKTVANPLEQARQCTYKLKQQLEKDPQLVHARGQYAGRLVMPYGFGVVLSNITRKQFLSTDLPEVLPEHQVICRDEMETSGDPEDFQKRLWDMFNVQFSRQLTLPQIDRVRWHLFPEIRINSTQEELFDGRTEKAGADTIVPDLIQIMDYQQERLARSLGSGHRVIHGVAGSGKTMILGYRCLYLAQLLHKPILVLCYNITLAARLKALMTEKNVADKVNVYHFHDWCGEMLRRFHIRLIDGEGDRFDRTVESVIDAVTKGGIPRGQYGAVLIDEGHDMKSEWLRLVSGMVDPETDSLLLLYDDTQSIYKDKSELGFTLSSVGIQARGRTTILNLNYRNTDEILKFAYRFVSHYLKPNSCDEDQVPIIEPATAGRRGPDPSVREFKSFDEEAKHIVDIFRKLHERRGIPWTDMCVTYSQKWMGVELSQKFQLAGIPVSLLHDRRAKMRFNPDEDSVKLMTMHSSKGLEFSTVAVCGVGYMASAEGRTEDDAKLLYVAMTRAMQNLLVTMSRRTRFTEKLLVA
jgi:superfamily I DNA and RNA helicase